jgi:hypothetical protein
MANTVLIKEIILHVSRELKRELHVGEQTQIKNFITNLEQDLLQAKTIEKTKKALVNTLVKEFSKNKVISYARSYEDSKETLAKQIGTTSDNNISHGVYDAVRPQQSSAKPNDFLGLTTPTEVARMFNPKSTHKRNHLILDSRYRVSDGVIQDTIRSYSWYYIPDSQMTPDGSVNIVGNVRDIIGFRIYPFRIPYTYVADNQYSKISLCIEELKTQSFIAHEGRRFHYMLNSNIDSNYINLDADTYNGFFWFEKPITTLDKITITFGNPLEQITFDNDRDLCSIDYFTYAPLTKIKTTITHKLKNGDSVYFTNFKTGFVDPNLVPQVNIDSKIKQDINSINGFLITVVNSYEFTIDYNSSIIQSPISDLKVDVYYGSKRLFIPFEVIYINPII